jgi:RHS repeat-associated protein
VEKWNSSGSDNIYFYGPSGKLLTVVQVNVLGSSPWMTLSTLSNRVYFGGMLLGTTTGYAVSDADLIKDRLGSVQPSYAYGTDTGSGQQTSPGDDFATYWKDSSSGFEYAMNRYYSAGYGRFLTVDPFGGSVNVNAPGSMNRYTYSEGDPVNGYDPTGLCDASGYAEICDNGYCPPQFQYCGYGPPGTDYGINDPSQGNCGTTSGFVDGDTGETVDDGSGCVTPPNVTPPPPPSDCSISLYEREAGFKGSPGDHTYLLINDPNDPFVAAQGNILEGGPQFPGWKIWANYGSLIGLDQPVGVGNLPGTNPSTNVFLGSDAGSFACAVIPELMSLVQAYDFGPKVTYHPLGWFNSNSFTYTLLNDIGLSTFFALPINWVPGWGQTVQGLQAEWNP